MQNFNQFGLPKQLLCSLEQLNFTTPTPIQANVIPKALNNLDVLASAQTGTGKTAAFGIPLITRLLNCNNEIALVIAPTRELATQVEATIKSLIGKSKNNLYTCLLIGGESIIKQLKQLKQNPRIIVGTPGRINDHLKRKTLNLSHANFLVLDETDRMLDMGFTPQIEEIIKSMPKERQTIMLSATLPPKIMHMAKNYLRSPEIITLSPEKHNIEKLKQEILFLSDSEKEIQLEQQLEKRSGSVIVFVKTKIGAEKMAKRLRKNNHSVDTIHGDLRHNKRERVISAFRKNKYRIMVATDIAARGLDIPHVEHVINYDLPQCPEDYIHRIGRTARAGREGSALCFVSPSDKSKWSLISKLLDPSIKEEKQRKGGNKPSNNKKRFNKPKIKNDKKSDFFGQKQFKKKFASKKKFKRIPA